MIQAQEKNLNELKEKLRTKSEGCWFYHILNIAAKCKDQRVQIKNRYSSILRKVSFHIITLNLPYFSSDNQFSTFNQTK